MKREDRKTILQIIRKKTNKCLNNKRKTLDG